MATRPTFPLYDQVLNGRLEEILRRYQDQKLSTREIHTRLGLDHGIHPSHPTVGRWLRGEAGAPASLKNGTAA